MRRVFLAAALCGAALLIPAGAAQAGDFVANLHAPTHHPHAKDKWRIKVGAHTRSGRPLKAKASYKFIYQGQVVATRYPSPHRPKRNKPWPFKGSYTDPVHWPKRAVGYKLTFRVVVETKNHGTENLDYKVRVKR